MENILDIDEDDDNFNFESLYGLSEETKEIQFELEMAFCIYKDKLKYFNKLLSSKIFTEFTAKEKIERAIIAISFQEEQQDKYLKHLIIDSNIKSEILEPSFKKYYDFIKDKYDYIEYLLSIRKLHEELPINNKEEKKIKV